MKLSRKGKKNLLKGTIYTTGLSTIVGLAVGTHAWVTHFLSENEAYGPTYIACIFYGIATASFVLCLRLIKLEKESLEDELSQAGELDQYGHVDKPHY